MSVIRDVVVRLGERAYPVRVGAGLLEEVGSFADHVAAGLSGVGPTMLVTNPTVAALYLEPVAASLDAHGARVCVVEIPDGEEHKTLRTVEHIYDRALEAGADRSSLVVALGGGVVGDVAGFAAATLLRGLRLLMVPTTLLAQVDSSVGGKTGVNRPQGKNLVGAFHQPSMVVADPTTLVTLPEREYRAGLAEVVKYGVILDAGLFERIEREHPNVLARDVETMTDVVSRCVELKARVVERDETESGLRRILNFGHTLGHAIEQATGYRRFLHGEAVAIGMVAAARISQSRGFCSADDVRRIESLLVALGLATEVPPDIDRAALERAIGHDKKAQGKRIAFIACTEIGGCCEVSLEPREIAEVIG